MHGSSFNGAAVLFVTAMAPLLWAGNFVVARALHETIGPFQLKFLRWVVAGLILLPVCIGNWRGIAAAVAACPMKILALGSLSVASFNWLIYAGLQHSTASTSGAIFALTPLFILIISQAWRGARLKPRDGLGAALAFCGAAFVVQMELGGTLVQRDTRGPLLLLAGSLVWALYTVALRRWRVPLPPHALLAAMVVTGLLLMAPFALVLDMPPARTLAEPAVMAGILYVGIGASIVAFCAWQTGVAQIGAVRAGVFLHLVPVFTLILGVLLLDESLTPQKLVGVAMVVLGVIVTQTGPVASPGASRA